MFGSFLKMLPVLVIYLTASRGALKGFRRHMRQLV